MFKIFQEVFHLNQESLNKRYCMYACGLTNKLNIFLSSAYVNNHVCLLAVFTALCLGIGMVLAALPVSIVKQFISVAA